MTEKLSAFREAVRCYRLVTQGDGRSGWAYMQAVRRAQTAFGLPFNTGDGRAAPDDWAAWVRLNRAIHRWGSR